MNKMDKRRAWVLGCQQLKLKWNNFKKRLILLKSRMMINMNQKRILINSLMKSMIEGRSWEIIGINFSRKRKNWEIPIMEPSFNVRSNNILFRISIGCPRCKTKSNKEKMKKKEGTKSIKSEKKELQKNV